MSDLIPAALAMSQQNIQDQLAMSMIKAKAQADQALADMIEENADRLKAMSAQASARGGVDIYV